MSQKWWALIAVGCGTFMATIDASIVNIALAKMSIEFDRQIFQLKWIVVAYFLAITCLLLPFGRLSDQWGRKRVFTIGFGVFTFGSVLCGVSPSLELLIASRIIQATGAAMLMANGPAIITAAFPAHQRGVALGTLAMIVSVGLISGPAIGGILILKYSWRSIFLVNLPIGIMGIALAWKFIREENRAGQTIKQFDWLGACLQSLMVISLVLVFFQSSPGETETNSNLAVLRWFLLPASAGLAYWFYRVESKSPVPLFDMTLLKIKTFWRGNLAAFLMFVAYSAVAVVLPYYLETSYMLPTDETGWLMSAIPIVMLFISPASGRISDLIGSRELCSAGAAVQAVALIWMSGVLGMGVTMDVDRTSILISLCAIGLALGLFQSPNNNAIMSSVPESKLNVASALMATVRNLGLFVGAGLSTTIFSLYEIGPRSSADGFQAAFIVASLISLVAVITSLGKQRGPHWKNHELERSGQRANG